MRITFKIKSGLKFQSGNPVTAADAEFSLRPRHSAWQVAVDHPAAVGWAKDNVEKHIRAEGEQPC